MTAPREGLGRCSGACGRTVRLPGMWCFECWVEDDTSVSLTVLEPPPFPLSAAIRTEPEPRPLLTIPRLEEIHAMTFREAEKVASDMERRRISDAEFQGITEADLNRLDTKPELHLRFQVLDAAYKVAFGTAQEKTDALETLAHLVNVLQQENKRT